MPAAYTDRLRLEGATLAAAGIAGSAALLAGTPQARRWPASTLGQLAIVAVALAWRGPGQVDGWMSSAQPVGDPTGVTGEPTPLWHVPVPMLAGVVLTKGGEAIGGPLRPLTSRAGWDAALRVTAGSALVGLFQAVVLAPRVRRAEAAEGRTYVRLPGSRLGKGTLLGWVPRAQG
jgi:hypothetical protein